MNVNMNPWICRVVVSCVAILVLAGCEEDDEISGGMGDVTIQGRVLQFDSKVATQSDARKAAVDGVAVTELRSGAFATTDQNGVFVLRGVRAGHVSIRFRHAGISGDYSLNVMAGESVDLGNVQISKNGTVAISQADGKEETETLAATAVQPAPDAESPAQNSAVNSGASSGQSPTTLEPTVISGSTVVTVMYAQAYTYPMHIEGIMTSGFQPHVRTNSILVAKFTNMSPGEFPAPLYTLPIRPSTNTIVEAAAVNNFVSYEHIRHGTAGLCKTNFDVGRLD